MSVKRLECIKSKISRYLLTFVIILHITSLHVYAQWVQRGIDIDGEAINDLSASSVSLSTDGLTMAIGAIGNDGAGSNAGSVRVYVGMEWIKLDEARSRYRRRSSR